MNRIQRQILKYGSWVMLAIVALSFVWVVIFGIVDTIQLNTAKSGGLFTPNILKILNVYKETIVGAVILILSFIPAILLTSFNQIIELKSFDIFYSNYMDEDFDYFDDCNGECDDCEDKDYCGGDFDDYDEEEEE